jgi:hypothetical protein
MDMALSGRDPSARVERFGGMILVIVQSAFWTVAADAGLCWCDDPQ